MIKIIIRTIVLVLLAAATVPAEDSPQKSNPALNEVIHTLFGARGFYQTAISPDGRQVAWVEQLLDKNGSPDGGTGIFISSATPGAAPKRITAGDGSAHSESDVVWSPDSKRVAFLSDAAQQGQQQLYVADAARGSARKLTDVKGFLADPGWSPDGKTLAVLFTENAGRAAGPLVAETVQTGVIQEAVTEQRLALMDVSKGTLRQISPPDMYVYEYDWSPDNSRFVVTAAHGNGDNNWYIAKIYTLDANGSEMKSIYNSQLQIAVPKWSPDGKSVAFIAGLMSDEPSVGGDIFVIPAAGGDARNIMPEMKGSASWLEWTRDGRILFSEWIDGGTAIAAVDPDGANQQILLRSDDLIGASAWGAGVSLAADGKTAAVIRQSFSQPPEIWAGPIGDWKQITQDNARLKPAWGEAKSVHWTNEGLDLQGWLLYPSNFDASRKYPMVVNVHGGPGAMAHSSWPGPHSFAVALSGAGYFVFMPNPRGSFGSGEAFTRANVKDFGYGDWRDILTGVDAAIQQAPIDEHRLGLTGWSYGGYMTMWGITQTNRFAAAVAGAGIANYQSYYGENQIDEWMIPFFGASVYDDPAVYAKSSPITFIKNARTPTLILVGDSDGECPTPQSYEFWHALKTLGVETEFVVYEHEGHGFVDPKHQRDVIERVAAWFDRRLK